MLFQGIESRDAKAHMLHVVYSIAASKVITVPAVEGEY